MSSEVEKMELVVTAPVSNQLPEMASSTPECTSEESSTVNTSGTCGMSDTDGGADEDRSVGCHGNTNDVIADDGGHVKDLVEKNSENSTEDPGANKMDSALSANKTSVISQNGEQDRKEEHKEFCNSSPKKEDDSSLKTTCLSPVSLVKKREEDCKDSSKIENCFKTVLASDTASSVHGVCASETVVASKHLSEEAKEARDTKDLGILKTAGEEEKSSECKPVGNSAPDEPNNVRGVHTSDQAVESPKLLSTEPSDAKSSNTASSVTVPSLTAAPVTSTVSLSTTSSSSSSLTASSSSSSSSTAPSDAKQSSGVAPISQPGVEKPVRYRCPKCSRIIKDKRLLANHSCDSEAAGEEERVKIAIAIDKEKKTFVCKECNFTSSGHGFEEHLMCHLMLRPYQCLYCKDCFINRKEISRHVLKSHNGAKMSCALRALRKAKGLIKDVTAAGTLTFHARVAGKVPLEKDPEKKKKSGEATLSPTVKTSDAGGSQDTMVPTEGQAGGEPVKEHEADVASESKNQANIQSFSKLREVLTAENPVKASAEQKENSSTCGSSEDSWTYSNADEDASNHGLKIVASYSLQENQRVDVPSSSNNSSNRTQAEESSMAPNFIMSPPEPQKEPEVLSFLGPEKPIFKASPHTLGTMLPPPPLQRAPANFPAGGRHLASPPQLSGPTPSINPQEKNPNFFICGFNCLFSSLSTSEFREHTTNFHSSETYFPCYYCGHRSPNEGDLVRHISNHTHTHNKTSPLYVCGNDGCEFGTNMVQDFISHAKSTHPDVTEPVCSSCGDVFSDLSNLQGHMEENVIHIVNCPHCTSKATDRRAILNHISTSHPGKPKMVSVAKQLICHDRKVNNYEQMKQLREIVPPMLTPAPALSASAGSLHGSSVLDQIMSQHNMSTEGWGKKSGNSNLADVLTGGRSPSPTSPASRVLSPGCRRREATPDSGKSPSSENSGFDSVNVKEEVDDLAEAATMEDAASGYMIDENGIRRRIYVPMSERQAENYRCKCCTFIARDLKRLNCHERSHGMPPTKKERFKCMFCPQGFDSEMKFRLHITCHPGLIKFLLYRCKKCEFDTNQKHTIVKHITCNRDRKHRGSGPIEEQYTVVSRSLESRVLECEQCDYMTRHKIHMAIHYQREHGILRDKGEFSVEGLTPTDTPVSSYDQAHFGTPSSPISQGHFRSSETSSSTSSSFDFTKPTNSAKRQKDRQAQYSPSLTVNEITERNDDFIQMVSQQATLQPGLVLENQIRKFKCPICKYLLPKAADLKNHVKRHSEIGQITLVMFRCKYCSCMSTARELLYDHLGEKHPGKPIALVKKIVAIDTTEVDKSFAETSVEESFENLKVHVQNELTVALSNTSSSSPTSSTIERSPTEGSSFSTSDLTSATAYEQLFVIPEEGETFTVPLQCPKCSYSSYKKSEIVDHVTSLHPEIKVIGSDEDVEKLAKATTEDLLHATKQEDLPSGKLPLPHQEEVLIVPDDQVFKEPALCSRCNFATLLRREMVQHLQQCHPEISVMGRNSYPVWSNLGPVEESCVVGSGSLDAKIRCLYENYGTQMKCLICGTERPKKFFIHVHILRHLNIYLWKCAFCAHRGLQKYKMVDHIKKIHPGKPMSVRYLRVNVEAKVSQFLAQFNIIQNRKASLDEGLEVPYTATDDGEQDFECSDDSMSERASPGLERAGDLEESSSHTLGSDELDEKISCLYDYSDGVFYKCLACPNQFQRKFAVHRHIIISHLKVALLSCPYCGMEGVERHQMVDHILACHSTLPVSIRTNQVDLSEKVSDFLAKAASGNLAYELRNPDSSRDKMMNKVSSSKSDADYNYYNSMFRPFAMHKKPRVSAGYGKKVGKFKAPSFRFGNKTSSPAATASKPTVSATKSGKKGNLVDPDVIMLGRDALDKELSRLYQARPTGQLRCLVCRWEFPRKYPLHRHIMLKHLKMNLVGCPYCPFEGVEKYNVSTHIKEQHNDKPINIKYTQPNVALRVRQFVDDMANVTGMANSPSLIQKPESSGSNSRVSSPMVAPKLEKNFDDDDEDDYESEIGGTGNGKRKSKSSQPQSLVVAMFGKKKKFQPSSLADQDDIVVKTEVEDDEYEEGSVLVGTNGDNNDDENALPAQFDSDKDEEGDDDEDRDDSQDNDYYNEEDDPGADRSDYDPTDENSQNSSFSTLRRPLMQSYAPGSYRSPAGGKPKALDVITKIKVLKSRDGPITKFYCEKCKFTSLHRSNIVRHIYKIHEKYQTHTCPVCNYQTLSLMLMKKHTEKEHRGVEYKEDSFTLNPPRTKPKSRPLIGPLSFQRRRQNLLSKKLSSFPERRTAPGPKQYACAYCHYETDTQDDILKHTQNNHSQSESSTSQSKTTSSSSERRKSASAAASSACWDGSKRAVKRKVCDNEDGVVKRKRRFVFEKGDELIQCGYCDARETSMGRMQDHMDWDHPGQPVQCKRIPAWRFVCRSCAVKTMATSKMKYHLNRHVNYRPYTCSSCGAFFPSPDQCRRHSRSQGHEEQYMYVRNPKKETRVEELLEETRLLALKIQEEAMKDVNFDIANTAAFIASFQEQQTNLKRSSPTGSHRASASKKFKAAAKVAAEAGSEKQLTKKQQQYGKSAQTVGVEMYVTLKCYNCEFSSSTVNEVYAHHKTNHPGEKFLWTELDRGFTCDKTGEALPDSDGVPSTSTDVGYTTRMTLGAGNNSMRFKCKTCDFSSCVIQAMKSHLKSHQPKGFICPYCSRSFSGKEKLMRHQYCLHKGLALWVIHLRRSGTSGSSSTAKGQASTSSPAKAEPSPVHATSPQSDSELAETSTPAGSAGKPARSASQMPTTYLCSECDYVSESLFQYRLHLSQLHDEFKHRIRGSPSQLALACKFCSFVAETDAELSAHNKTHSGASRYQCGHCGFSADNRVSVVHHLAHCHPDEELTVLELSSGSPDKLEHAQEKSKDPPLLLNLDPAVSMERMPNSVLSQYMRSAVASEGEEEEMEEAEEEAEEEEGWIRRNSKEDQHQLPISEFGSSMNNGEEATYGMDDAVDGAAGEVAADEGDGEEEEEEELTESRLLVAEKVSKMDDVHNSQDLDNVSMVDEEENALEEQVEEKDDEKGDEVEEEEEEERAEEAEEEEEEEDEEGVAREEVDEEEQEEEEQEVGDEDDNSDGRDFESGLDATGECEELMLDQTLDDEASSVMLSQDERSSLLDEDSDMMIMQFGGVDSEVAARANCEGSHNMLAMGHDSGANGGSSSSSLGLHKSKDSLLSAPHRRGYWAESDNAHAGDNDVDDEDDNGDIHDANDDEDVDDEEEDHFNHDMSLASPLPMISLGDVVAMSPVPLEQEPDIDSNTGHSDCNENMSLTMAQGEESSDLLLDI